MFRFHPLNSTEAEDAGTLSDGTFLAGVATTGHIYQKKYSFGTMLWVRTILTATNQIKGDVAAFETGSVQMFYNNVGGMLPLHRLEVLLD